MERGGKRGWRTSEGEEMRRNKEWEVKGMKRTRGDKDCMGRKGRREKQGGKRKEEDKERLGVDG